MTVADPLLTLTLVEAARGLREGDFTAERYAAALLAQCDSHRGLNAFISLEPDLVRRRARAADIHRRAGRSLGSLHGLPIAVKDNIHARHLPASAGNRALIGFRPANDAAVLKRLGAAGAIVLGKTNLHELSMGWTGNNAGFGAVRNPYDRRRIAGGSSSGTAAAVAARLAPAGLGTDTNGSLRIPAALCGIATLRPSMGRYPSAGIVPLSHTLDVPGPMARTAGDLVLLDGAMTGRGPVKRAASLRGIRIGLARDDHFESLQPEVAIVIEAALRRLADAGAAIVDIGPLGLGDDTTRIAPAVINYEAARSLPSHLSAFATGCSLGDLAAAAGPDVRAIIDERLSSTGGQRISRHRYDEALTLRRRVQDGLRRCFEEHRLSVLAYPTTTVCAPAICRRFVSPAPDVVTAAGTVGARQAFGRNIAAATCAAFPSLVLPAGRSPLGLPVGLEFAAAASCDEALLGLGCALEAALGAIEPPAMD